MLWVCHTKHEFNHSGKMPFHMPGLAGQKNRLDLRRELNIALLQHLTATAFGKAADSTNERAAAGNEQPIGNRTGCTLHQSNHKNSSVCFPKMRVCLLFLGIGILASQRFMANTQRTLKKALIWGHILYFCQFRGGGPPFQLRNFPKRFCPKSRALHF